MKMTILAKNKRTSYYIKNTNSCVFTFLESYMSNTARSYVVKSKSRKNKTDFLPEHFRVFLSSKAIDILGVLLCVLGLIFALCLGSYSPTDPSLNSATTIDEVHNLLGHSGAYIADIFLQSFGIVSIIFPLVFIMSGWRILMRYALPKLWSRVTALIIGTIGLSVAFSSIPPIFEVLPEVHTGGSVGIVVLNTLTDTVQSFGINPILPIFGGIGAILAIFCLSYAIGMSWQHWLLIIYKVASSAYHVLLFSFRVTYSSIAKIMRFSGKTEGGIKPKKKRSSLKKLTESNNINRLQIPAVVKEREVKEIKQSSRVSKEQQPELLLNQEEWLLPTLNLLDEPPTQKNASYSPASLQRNAELLQNVLNDFGVEGSIVAINPGPIVTLYELEPAPGTKSSRIINLADDIARSMSTTTVRVAVIPGKNAIGIELPNANREMVFLKELLSSEEYEKTTAKLPIVLGKNIGGQPVIADLSKMPHLLVAGTTGSGKSVGINTIILSLLYKLSPEQCRLIMIDPKMLELSVYDDIPHLLTSVVTEPHKAVTALKWAVGEMEDRYRSMSKLGVRNLDGFNNRIKEAQKTGEVLMNRVQTGFDHETGRPVFEEQPIPLVEMPYIVIIVDEFADLMLVAGKEVESCIQRLAQMARAAGIHLIMATQRPSVDVITGVIKANFPTRISFQVTSKIDSRTILGENGAEQLLGRGDMLFMPSGEKIKRVHGPFVDDAEVEQVVSFLKEQGEPEYIDSVTTCSDSDGDDIFKGIAANNRDGYDELYDQALSLILREQKASTSFVQRHLQIGYNRAARIIEQMERDGIISSANHVGKRTILMEDHTGEFE